MSDEQLSVTVLQRVTEFLQSLPAPDLAAIADGRARLTHVPTEQSPAAAATPPGSAPTGRPGPTGAAAAPGGPAPVPAAVPTRPQSPAAPLAVQKASMMATGPARATPPATKMTTAAVAGGTTPLKSGATAVKAVRSSVRTSGGPGRSITAPVRAGTSLPRRPVSERPTAGPDTPPRPAISVAPAEAAAMLNRMESRDAGELYLSGLVLKDLKALAVHLDMRGLSSLRKGDLIDKIINRTIGYRLSFTSIRHL